MKTNYRKLKRNLDTYNKSIKAAQQAMKKMMEGGLMQYMSGGNPAAHLFGFNSDAANFAASPLNGVQTNRLQIGYPKAMNGGYSLYAMGGPTMMQQRSPQMNQEQYKRGGNASLSQMGLSQFGGKQIMGSTINSKNPGWNTMPKFGGLYNTLPVGADPFGTARALTYAKMQMGGAMGDKMGTMTQDPMTTRAIRDNVLNMPVTEGVPNTWFNYSDEAGVPTKMRIPDISGRSTMMDQPSADNNTPMYQEGGMSSQQGPDSQMMAQQMMAAQGEQMPGAEQQQGQPDEQMMAQLQQLAQAALQGDEQALQMIEQLPPEQQQIVLQILEQMQAQQGGGQMQGGQEQGAAPAPGQMMYGGNTKKKAPKKKKKGGYSNRSMSDKKMNKLYNSLGIPC